MRSSVEHISKIKYRVGAKEEFCKTISESDVYMFAGITGDMNPVHINEIEAAQSFAQRRIVHGALVSGMISTVIGMKLPGPGTIYMEQDSKFVKPVYIGDTIKAAVEIQEVLSEKKGILKLNTVVSNQKNEIVLTGFAVVMIPRGEHV